jgi:hypothetical protein
MADQPAAVRRPSTMACAFCAPQSRAGGAVVAQELGQLMGTVLEGSTKAVVAPMEFLVLLEGTRIKKASAPRAACGSGRSSAPQTHHPDQPAAHTAPSKHTGPGWWAIRAIDRPICAC